MLILPVIILLFNTFNYLNKSILFIESIIHLYYQIVKAFILDFVIKRLKKKYTFLTNLI